MNRTVVFVAGLAVMGAVVGGVDLYEHRPVSFRAAPGTYASCEETSDGTVGDVPAGTELMVAGSTITSSSGVHGTYRLTRRRVDAGKDDVQLSTEPLRDGSGRIDVAVQFTGGTFPAADLFGTDAYVASDESSHPTSAELTLKVSSTVQLHCYRVH